MRINSLKSGILCGCLIIFSACQRETLDAPKINFISPLMGEEIDPSKYLSIEADLSDDDRIKRYEIWLKSATGLELFHEDVTVNKKLYTLKYQVDLSSTSSDQKCIIRIMAEDSDGNKTSEEIQVFSKP